MTNRLIFPRAFAFAIDDLGWNEGHDLSQSDPKGPHRCGVKRHFDLDDYKHIVEVGKQVGARIQCLFIMGEMDRENILAKYPTTTYQRGKWNNTKRVSDDQRVIMKYVCDQAAYMEFGLHGTGHEYWAPGEPQKRAEWYNLADRQPWPEQSLREHIQCFRAIMAQYGITEANGHSFPESFVPCAYSYYWNPTGDYSLGKLLSEVGVKYANTDFGQIPELNPPTDVNGGGFDFDTHVINRINYGNVWYALATLPSTPLDQQQTDVIESHWPNWLGQDDIVQSEVTQQWVEYYRAVQKTDDRYIAKNTEQLHSQWLYNKHTRVTQVSDNSYEIDNTAMPDAAYKNDLLGNMVLKIKLKNGEHVSTAQINNKTIPGYFEDAGFGFLYLPQLKQEKVQLTVEVGGGQLSLYVNHKGTGNVYDIKSDGSIATVDVKVYGVQQFEIKCPRPKAVISSASTLKVLGHDYNSETGMLFVNIKAANMQGSRGEILIQH